MKEKIETNKVKPAAKQNKTSKELLDTLTKTKKLKVKYWNYESYEIQIADDKIQAIKFHYYPDKKYSFIVYINYNLHKKSIKEINFYEEKQENRYSNIDIIRIDNLKVFRIQKKVKVWYGETKFSPNYFKYLWINKNTLSEFIHNLLYNFHKDK